MLDKDKAEIEFEAWLFISQELNIDYLQKGMNFASH